MSTLPCDLRHCITKQFCAATLIHTMCNFKSECVCVWIHWCLHMYLYQQWLICRSSVCRAHLKFPNSKKSPSRWHCRGEAGSFISLETQSLQKCQGSAWACSSAVYMCGNNHPFFPVFLPSNPRTTETVGFYDSSVSQLAFKDTRHVKNVKLKEQASTAIYSHLISTI